MYPIKSLFNFSHLLSNLSEVSTSQQLQVRGQGTGLYHLLEPPFVKRGTKKNIISHCGILDPGLLRHKCKGALGGGKKARQVRL